MAETADLEIELPRAASAAPAARYALRGLCGDRIDDELLLAAQLLVTELAANALIHGQGAITMRALLDEDRLLVEVIDEGSGFERDLRRKEFWQIGGWGLQIVDEFAARWGVHEGTTHVWFELERPGPRLAEADASSRPAHGSARSIVSAAPYERSVDGAGPAVYTGAAAADRLAPTAAPTRGESR